jgi:hypothetical protein
MKILYTLTDEAPALATRSLFPILEAFAAAAEVEVELRDISLAGRILAQFPERLTASQRVGDALTELGELTHTVEANIIKLPNVSASLPQLKAAIAELQSKGYAVPDYPDEPVDEEQREAHRRYDRVKGSAVNPVLRQGNSDRRAAASVKRYARAHPHSMGAWSSESRSHVATMSEGDFASTERSLTVAREGTLTIEHVAPDGAITTLKQGVPGPGRIARRRRDAPCRAGHILCSPDRRGQGAGRAVLRPPQGDDDEGLGSDHLRARGARLLLGSICRAWRCAGCRRRRSERWHGGVAHGDRGTAGGRA